MKKGGKKTNAKCSKCPKCDKCDKCTSCPDCDERNVCEYSGWNLNYKTILATTLCTLIIMLVLLVVTYFGIRMAGNNIVFVDSDSSVAAILPVNYYQDSVNYDLGNDSEANRAAKVFADIDFSVKGDNYAVIRSRSQLDQLIAALPMLPSASSNAFGTDSRFFETGSILAVAVEDEDYRDVALSSVMRDEKYNIQVDLNASKQTSAGATTGMKAQGHLILIQIQNIQPEIVEVNINEI